MSRCSVTERISSHLRPGVHCYVLIDLLARPTDSEHSLLAHLQQVIGNDQMIALVRPDLDPRTTLCPVLACLSSVARTAFVPLLSLTAEVAHRDLSRRRRLICGWLLSAAPLDTVAAQILDLCQLPIGAGPRTFCPIYEPLRLELLATQLEQPDQGSWWPIEQWLFLDSAGHLTVIQGQAQAQHQLQTLANPSVLHNDVAQIENILIAWRILLGDCGDCGDRPPLQLPAGAATHISRCVTRARSLGLSTSADIEVLVLHWLCVHPELEGLQPIRAMLDQVIEQQRPLAPMLSRVSDASWRQWLALLAQSAGRP